MAGRHAPPARPTLLGAALLALLVTLPFALAVLVTELLWGG
ncbi:hypothetical protein [Oceaniglobus roseus]|nr:hypothetical protein [Kandeliimicrobium roseum]